MLNCAFSRSRQQHHSRINLPMKRAPVCELVTHTVLNCYRYPSTAILRLKTRSTGFFALRLRTPVLPLCSTCSQSSDMVIWISMVLTSLPTIAIAKLTTTDLSRSPNMLRIMSLSVLHASPQRKGPAIGNWPQRTVSLRDVLHGLPNDEIHRATTTQKITAEPAP